MSRHDMTVVILCGGLGTRAYPYTSTMPKALMRVGDAPIVEQVMRIYASFGYWDFVLSVGYLKEQIIEYFDGASRNYGWRVRCIDTGDKTDTGGRILGVRDFLTPTFHATYCDGLGDVDIDALVDFHEQHDGASTMTAVPLRSQYGIVGFEDGGRVTHFEEKPVIHDRWINAGFFVFDTSAFDDWSGENLERHVLPGLAGKRRLFIYQHQGFWRSMDTHKDQQELTPLWQEYAPRYIENLRRSAQDGVGSVIGALGGD
jgi:glucose-1-phosphate cytidylyltransferase